MKIRRSGISEVVAALILLAITIGAFAFLVSGYFLKTQNTVQNIVLLYKQGQIKQGQFLSVIFHSEKIVGGNTANINVTLMNYGLYPIQIQNIYIDGNCVYSSPGSIGTCPAPSQTVPPPNFCVYDSSGSCVKIICPSNQPIYIGLAKSGTSPTSLCGVQSQSWPQVITIQIKGMPCSLLASGCSTAQFTYEFFLYSSANQAYVWQL